MPASIWPGRPLWVPDRAVVPLIQTGRGYVPSGSTTRSSRTASRRVSARVSWPVIGDSARAIWPAPTSASCIPPAVRKMLNGAPVGRVGRPLQETPLLGPVNQAGDRRFIEPQIVGQLTYPGPPVPQDGQHPELGQRQIVLGGDPAEHGHGGE